MSHKVSQMFTIIDQIEEPIVLGSHSKIRQIKANIQSLQSITGSLINATLSLSENSELENVHIFQHRRRQWTSQLLKIIYSMDQVEDNDSIGIISSIIHALLLHGILPIPSEDSAATDLPLSLPSHSYVPSQLKRMVHVHFDDSAVDHQTEYAPAEVKPKSNLSLLFPPYLGELKHFQENITDSTPAYSLLRPAPKFDKNTATDTILKPSNINSDNAVLDSSFSSHASFTTKTLASVAFRLQQDTRVYMDEGNPFLEIAKNLSQLMYEMSDLSKARGEIKIIANFRMF